MLGWGRARGFDLVWLGLLSHKPPIFSAALKCGGGKSARVPSEKAGVWRGRRAKSEVCSVAECSLASFCLSNRGWSQRGVSDREKAAFQFK